ncbi:MAG: TatD family hydrolase [Elusimicrobia bacterium]|nr:TatD family hydrolase [Elusimicrobiota bacterium]
MAGPDAAFFDTHVHLTDPRFDPDRAEVLERAAAAGVGRLVEIGDSPDEWARVLAFVRARPADARCALGLHPYYADQCTESFLERLRAEVEAAEVVAIGEIGLDYARGPVAPDIQKAALRRLLAACRDWGKPAVIHCRGAYADLRAIVAEIFPPPPPGRRFWGVVHCFSGEPEDAEFFAAAGFAIGADGPATYPKNEALREVFRRVGAGSTVLETDSPYLPPQSRRGRRNEPRAIPEIAAALALAWGMSVVEVARLTTANAGALFGWP